MIKVKNKHVVAQVARATYKGHKRRNFLTILAIILTTFLISVVIGLGTSYWNTLSTRQVRMSGMDYDIELSEPREDQVAKIRSLDTVQYAGLQVKCGIIQQYKNTLLDKTRMYWIDEICWNKQMMPALEYFKGHYPKEENEIMISSSALKAMGIKNPKLGMDIDVTYFTLDTQNEQQEFIQKSFVLSGYYKDYSGSDQVFVSNDFYHATGVKQTDFTQGSLKITLQSSIYTEAEIMDFKKEIKLDNNQYLSADSDSMASFIKTLIGLIAMLLMVFLSGYLFVYNTLYISITKDIQYYGQLKTMGMTSKQLKSLVYKQAMYNSIIAIPLGLLIAYCASVVVIPQFIHIANADIKVSDVSQVQPMIYVVAAIFSFLTNMISAHKPARICGACSSIEALRYTGISSTKQGHKIQHISENGMAIHNIFRDKKQAYIILLSFIIAIGMFIVVNVIVEEHNARTVLNTISNQDIKFKNETILDDEGPTNLFDSQHIARIKRIKGVASVGVVRTCEATIPYQSDVFSTYIKEMYESRYSPGNYEKDLEKYKHSNDVSMAKSRLVAINDIEFEKINKELGNRLDKKAFHNGEYAILSNFFGSGKAQNMKGKTFHYYIENQQDQLHSIKVQEVVNSKLDPAYFAGGYMPNILISDTYINRIYPSSPIEIVNVSYDKSFDFAVEHNVKKIFANEKKISYESKIERYEDMKKTEDQVRILGSSMGILMAMLALLNYINMMVASVQHRSIEFATLEAIGMTKKQIKNVLIKEGIGYAIISIILSIIISIPLSYMVFESMNTYQVPYVFPWISNIVLFICIIIACIIVPVITYRITQKGSVVERMKENIT